MTTGLLTTNAGNAAIIADLAGGANLALTHVAFGDASGVPYPPNPAQTVLVNERYRSTISAIAVVPGAIVIECQIPADTNDASGRASHGFLIAEAGLFAVDGTLIGVARMGNGLKPSPGLGQAAVATFQFKLACANPSAITVVIDPVAQIHVGRQVRPFFMCVNGVGVVPPINPAMGDTYAVNLAATGAWTGFPGRLAQWVGVWAMSLPPLGHIVVDMSKDVISPDRYMRSILGGWTTAEVSPINGGFISPGSLRRQGLNWRAGSISGTATSIGIALVPPIASYSEIVGTPLRFVATSDAVSSTDVSLDDLPPLSLTYPKGESVRQGAWLTGETVEIIHDGFSFRLIKATSPDQVQKGAFNFAPATNVGNVWTTNLVPAPPAGMIVDGFRLWTNVPATPTGLVTFNGNGTVGNLVGPDGILIGKGDLLTGNPLHVQFRNGLGWQVVGETMKTRRLLRENLRIYPELSQPVSALLLISAAVGIVQVADGNTIVFRGHEPISSEGYAIGLRTFATVANKTYHLRWRSAWHISPGFALVDVTAFGAAEGNEAYDSTYDDALLARVITDGGNNPSVLALENRQNFVTLWNKTSVETNTTGFASFTVPTFTQNYARQPRVTILEFNCESSVDYEAITHTNLSVTRYQSQAFVRAVRLIGNSFATQEYIQGQMKVRIDG